MYFDKRSGLCILVMTAVIVISVIFGVFFLILIIWYLLIRFSCIKPTFQWCERFVLKDEEFNHHMSESKKLFDDAYDFQHKLGQMRIDQSKVDQGQMSRNEFFKKHGRSPV